MPTAAFANLGCKVNQYETERIADSFERLGFTLTDFDAPADVYVINTCSVTGAADRKSRHLARKAARQSPGARVVLTGCFAQTALDTGEAVEGATLLVPNAQKMRAAAHVLSAFPDLIQYSSSPASEAAGPHPGASRPPSPIRMGDGPVTTALMPLDEWHSAVVSGPSPAEPGEGGRGTSRGGGLPVAVFPEDLISPASLAERPQALHRTRGTLKVQDGCTYFCAFCSIPYTRATLASRAFADVVAEARQMAEQGIKEVVVTGVCVGAYGPETGSGGARLAEVLLAVADIPGIARVRLSSVQPVEVPDEIIRAMATHPHIAPHLHLSLQSGDDTMLRAMNRPYDTRFFAEHVARLRAAIPRIGLTTDLIVGFPGETRALFENTLAFAARIGFARTHVFRYSPRPRTAAAERTDDVPPEEKECRHRELSDVCLASQRAFAAAELGQTAPVLVEGRGRGAGWLSGYTGNYIRVQFEAPPTLRGEIVPVTLTDITPDGDALGVLSFPGREGAAAQRQG
ncbi:MAG: tRNA (N(6)-L-threonylcarbamoyladenosine(37)-C(2))-methylthiotransferase MtaB [Armatimonadetes bacterium]|nr:tRNA (N(6)-L-threonylcarbamoyladenosine(37)-C(2))-methylthiotransferase MtaB [Armatimonadota bacterium]